MLDQVLVAIVEPQRRKLLELVRQRELSAGEIAAHFSDITRPAVSQHLSVLLQAGLVSMRRQGTRRLYQARPEGLAELRGYLESYWDARLLDLKSAVENEEWRKKAHGN